MPDIAPPFIGFSHMQTVMFLNSGTRFVIFIQFWNLEPLGNSNTLEQTAINIGLVKYQCNIIGMIGLVITYLLLFILTMHCCAGTREAKLGKETRNCSYRTRAVYS